MTRWRPRRVRAPAAARGSFGQATIELVLVLPVVLVALLLVVQVALVGLAHVLVVHAARTGARTAAVEPSSAAVRAAVGQTPGLRADRLAVQVGTRGPPGSMVAVTVRYRAPTDLPLVGPLVGDPTLEATVVMQVESDGTEPVPVAGPP